MIAKRNRHTIGQTVSAALGAILALSTTEAALAQVSDWTPRAPNEPPPRMAHPLSYDSARGV